MRSQTRKPTNLSLDQSLLSDARDLKINLSRAAEQGVRLAVKEAQAVQWKLENARAFISSNTFVEKRGLPLEKHRQS